MTDLLFTNARLLDPSQNIDAVGYLAVTDGNISAIGVGTPEGADVKATKTIDCGGQSLAPGIVDMRVQTADPGSEHLEDLPSLLRAAAAAGVTGFVIDLRWPDSAGLVSRLSAFCCHGNR